MYLFCCTHELVDEVLYKAMLESCLHVNVLPLLNLDVNHKALDYIKKNFNQFDSIIFTSPKSINTCRLILSNIINTKIYTVGESSAKIVYNIFDDLKIDLVNNSISVIYPKMSSGGEALIKEILSQVNLIDNRVLLVNGNYGNIMLENWLLVNNVNYVCVHVYNQVKISVTKDKFCDLFKTKVSGIVVSSSIIVRYLFELAGIYQMLDVLRRQKFITIHKHIAQVLITFGISPASIMVSNTVSKQDLVYFIGTLSS